MQTAAETSGYNAESLRPSAANTESGFNTEAGTKWVTTEVAATALGVSPRTIRSYIQSDELEAKSEGTGVAKRWLVSMESIEAMWKKRRNSRESPRSSRADNVEPYSAAEGLSEVAAELVAAVQDLQYRLGRTEAHLERAELAEAALKAERDRLIEDLKHERGLTEQLKQEKLEAERNAYQLGREKVEAQKAIQQITQEQEEAQEEARRLREAAQKDVRRLREELAAERSKGFFRRLFGR